MRELVLDIDGYCIVVNGKEHKLRPIALNVCRLFFSQPGKVFSADQIREAGWRHDESSDISVRQIICELRRIMGKDKIKNHCGVGYKLML